MDAENYACRKMRLIFGACRYPRLRSTQQLFVVTGQKTPLLLPMVG
jgi:hypothetical protein